MPLINQQNQLIEICSLINDHKITAIDTEFIRETTYLPILCLIQINVDGVCYVVDALSNLDLAPLFKILSDPKIIKIFHSSRQDMEVFLINFPNQITPEAIFDTQIMAALCGLGFNISYSNLAKNLLDVEISKDWQRSDWQKRPLHPEQMVYAKIDVLHLPKIYQILNEQLAREQKLDWAKDEMDFNVQKATAEDDLVKNFSFANKSFVYRENVILLTSWRDVAARFYNVPRGFVIKDEVLDKIAFNAPNDLETLEKCGFKTRVLKKNIKEEIIDLLNNKSSLKVVESKKHNSKTALKLTEAQKEIYQQSRVLLQEQAKKYQINPELVINQTNLQHLISGYKSITEILPGWRYVVFGEELEKLIA
ncbi:MAG: ribonuclease D [Pseudomonadota bacterium]